MPGVSASSYHAGRLNMIKICERPPTAHNDASPVGSQQTSTCQPSGSNT